MEALDLARWQFGITTVYHFLFVPITIGLGRARRDHADGVGTAPGTRATCGMTKFFGKLFLINFAMGVVTGIVQEFQFGMDWSDYSRFVGDVFGAPLAIEGLAAFFLESTFSASGSSDGTGCRAGCTWRRSGRWRSARRCRRASSWRRTRSCSTRSATSSTPSAAGPS